MLEAAVTLGVNHVLGDLIQFHDFKYHDSLMTSQFISPARTISHVRQKSNSLFNISAWISNGHFKINGSKAELLNLFHKPAPLLSSILRLSEY